MLLRGSDAKRKKNEQEQRLAASGALKGPRRVTSRCYGEFTTIVLRTKGSILHVVKILDVVYYNMKETIEDM